MRFFAGLFRWLWGLPWVKPAREEPLYMLGEDGFYVCRQDPQDFEIPDGSRSGSRGDA